ncbi:hypothetical protein SLE2022_028260 [Rubroshorea leprosula]
MFLEPATRETTEQQNVISSRRYSHRLLPRRPVPGHRRRCVGYGEAMLFGGDRIGNQSITDEALISGDRRVA